MSSTSEAIRVESLRREFDATTAVDGLSFAVEEGELFGLLGPNGAGKSTLINMLCTLLAPTGGTASVAGHDVRTDTAGVRDSIGIVFQEPALDEELTAEENLAFHARLYGLDRAERAERIGEVLALVDLVDERDTLVKQFSDGMKRRLEIARGLVHRPAVLFLDEPTLGLDAGTRRDTWAYIRRLNDEAGVTVVLTTHYMDEADQLCDRVAVVDSGRIVALDAPQALKDDLGGDVISVELADGDDADRLTAALRDRPWVASVEETADGLAVTVERGETKIPALVGVAADVGATVTAVGLHSPTLETVFLSLTGTTMAESAEPDASSEASESDDSGSLERSDSFDGRDGRVGRDGATAATAAEGDE
ncbi:ATP-binding cassette domain-containing protein [Halorarum halobium]|uniref:ATP-binding cassette domain-containing protein n=1 Tax=Halorarum halobium TaxID=3075121 RepID=UPI0028AE8793|nr:ATP-binding cassette domain-containing protein [Halobaculum sp. XH14]